MLHEPLHAGRLRVPNRIVFTAHLTGYASNGLPTAQHAAYYAARAAGGAGLVITEEHSVHPHDRPYEKLIRGHDPAVLPGYRAITDAVHAHGAVVLAQLNHNGPQSSGLYSREPVRGPSPVPDPMFREVPVAMTEEDLDEVVAGYARTARHCVEGGFDGVELQCSHASLVRCFLSPATNHRDDAYGGALENRARLLLRIVAAVRRELGDRVLGVRLGGEEGIEGGIGLDEGVALARLLEATGEVDHLNTSIGVATASLHLIEASMHTPANYATFIPSAVRAAVRLPVIAVGRFTGPALAEQALVEGHCDLVGVARGQIASPNFAAPGGPTRVCVGCNQECVGRVGMNRPLGCAVNPRAGHESVPLPAPGVPRRVLVIGGGPAGRRAAATAAARGHRVTLHERDRLGGQLALAALAPGRGELAHVVRDLVAEGERSGVEFRRGEPEDLDADVVVLATGARPARRWPGALDVRDVLDGSAAPTGTVLVVDELGFHQATSVAELLAARGCTVEIVAPGMVVGQDLGLTLDREGFRRRAHAAGIRLTTDRLVTTVAPGRATLVHHPTGRTETREVDAVVCAIPAEPDDALWPTLRERPGVHRIGDCLAPRRMDAAVRDGERLAVSL
ncbi:mycofactocin system FadH/OYE family oxidoreductase 2 [Pseudonocardia lutea]|uniref:Mycofactocin system FadH/OYE family oxidoreductase 2 n=1 Tax=Pseudonocardia lutea TaxID=2172015 RepID=A0ABW1I7L1_9PSEU